MQRRCLSNHVCEWVSRFSALNCVSMHNHPLPTLMASLIARVDPNHSHTYTWLDNKKNPIKIPAIQYINPYKELNTCFIHFINVGKLFNLLGDKEIEPMQPLVDVWLAKGLLPPPPNANTEQQPLKENVNVNMGGQPAGQAV